MSWEPREQDIIIIGVRYGAGPVDKQPVGIGSQSK